MESIVKDLRFGLRMLVRQPSVYAVAILTLALGIGFNSAIFSFAKAALFDPLPYDEAQRLVVVWQDYERRGGPQKEWLSYPNFVDYRAQNQTLEDLAVFEETTFVVTANGEPESVTGERVSPAMFDLLGGGWLHGRGFRPEEGNRGAASVAVVSHGFWQRRFASDPEAVGRQVVLDDEPHTVVGVLPKDFFMPLVPDVAVVVPLKAPEPTPDARQELTLRAIGRLKAGMTLAQVRTDLEGVAQRIEQENPDAVDDVGAAAFPLRTEVMGEAKPVLMALLVTMAMILLIACVNVANLLLARATARREEIGLRAALGAQPQRIVRQIFVESLLLSFVGGGLAIVLAVAGVDMLKGLARATAFPLPNLDSVQVDGGVLGFALLVTVFSGLLFGLAPVLEVRRTDIVRTFQGVASGRSTARRTGRVLVVLELALALVLLVGAGLMLRSLGKLQQVDTGFDPAGILAFEVQTPRTRYPEGHQVESFYGDLLENIRSLPGVVSAGAVSSLPMGGSNTDARLRIEGREESEDGVKLWYRIVTPGYFETSGLSVLQGRGLEAGDKDGAPLVIVINGAAAKLHFPGENPVGRGLLTSADRYEIVGVVQDGRSFSLKAEEPPAIYFSHGQISGRAMGIVVRTLGDPWQLAKPVRSVLSELDPAIAATDLQPLEELIAASVASERALGILMSAFGLLALTLAGIGLYGLIAYLTSQWSREIGIRMALGAERAKVIGLVLKEALTLSFAGLVVGLLVTLGLTRFLKSMLFEISAFDAVSFVVSAVILTLLAVLASYLPARRASRLDPARVLRG